VIDTLFDRRVLAGLGNFRDPRRNRVQIEFHTLRSFGLSPSKNARWTQRVMQWYQRVTAGSTKCARAMVIGGSPDALHAAQSIESL